MADALAWKHVDDTWEKIKENPRNLRLGLSADGINPHSFLVVTIVVGQLLWLFIISSSFMDYEKKIHNVEVIDIET